MKKLQRKLAALKYLLGTDKQFDPDYYEGNKIYQDESLCIALIRFYEAQLKVLKGETEGQRQLAIMGCLYA